MSAAAFDTVSLLEAGLALLQDLLGSDYSIGSYNVAGAPQAPVVLDGERSVDRLVAVKDPSGAFSVVLVEATRQLVPVDARERLVPRMRLMGQLMGESTVLVISQWLSPRTREVLTGYGFSYLDLTGNVSFRLRRPAVLLQALGADRDPYTPSRRQRSLSGARAGRLVRLMVDVAPPYRANELAMASAVSEGWVSRVLDAMQSQALIRRDGRQIVDVDWQGLLRERAKSVQLLKTNTVTSFVAAGGLDAVLGQLSNPEVRDAVAITGSIAAQAIVPRAVGGQLMAYVRGEARVTDRLARSLRLLPAEHNGNVLLLHPPNDVVFERSRLVGGAAHVAISQVALDCLSGNGRMPAEGEAVIEYMAEDETRWRRASLSHL